MGESNDELEKRITHEFTHQVEPDWNNQGNKRFLSYAIRQIKKAKLEVLRELYDYLDGGALVDPIDRNLIWL